MSQDFTNCTKLIFHGFPEEHAWHTMPKKHTSNSSNHIDDFIGCCEFFGTKDLQLELGFLYHRCSGLKKVPNKDSSRLH